MPKPVQMRLAPPDRLTDRLLAEHPAGEQADLKAAELPVQIALLAEQIGDGGHQLADGLEWVSESAASHRSGSQPHNAVC